MKDQANRSPTRPLLLRRPLPLTLLACGLMACGADDTGPDEAPASEESSTDPKVFVLPAGAERFATIETVLAEPRSIAESLILPGSVGFNLEQCATVSARIHGVVGSTRVKLGDRVEVGQALGSVSSPELARIRSQFLEEEHHLAFATAAMEREQKLFDKQAASEESLVAIQHQLEEATLAKAAAQGALDALGAPAADPDGNPANLVIQAPIGGTIVAKDARLGKAVETSHALFEIADLSTVWVDVRAPSHVVGSLSVGDPVRVLSAQAERVTEATIGYLDAQVDVHTQTVLVRIEVTNDPREWRPGAFVSIEANVASGEAEVALPAHCVHELAGSEERAIAFVLRADGAWEAREIELGRRSSDFVEVAAGLQVGERVAASDGVLLKSAWMGLGGVEE